MKDYRELLQVALEAARAASTAILEIYAGDFAVTRKADKSPVTAADERAEAIIIAALQQAAPDIPAIAEEQSARGGPLGAAPARFWLIDPVDGTREFVKRNGEFTVNIALVEGDRVVLGVVLVPVTATAYWGCGPGTAMRQQGAAPPQAIAARAPPADGVVVTHSRSHADMERIDTYLASLPRAQPLIIGSSIKFCLIAAGEADFYPRFGPTSEWDTGAGQAVLEAAGGHVATLDGAALRYGKPGFRNPDFIARGRV